MALIQDITHRKQIEQETLSLQKRLQFLLSSSRAMIYTCQLEGDYGATFMSQNVTSILGYSPEDFTHNSNFWADHIHPEDAPQVFASLPLVFEQNSYTHEYRFLHREGHYVWLRDELQLVRDQQGNPVEIVGYFADITDRKHLEFEHQEVISELQKSNNLLFAISEAQSEFITAGDRLLIFENLLSRLLELTDSEYGFIGEVLFQEDGSARIEESFLKIRGIPYLKTHSITNVAWNEATQKLYEENHINGMEFHNLNTLFGAVITTEKPVIANHPSTDPRRGGTPEGHPLLNAFLGLPFFKGTTLVAMVGIANRPGGYDQSMINYLQPFLVTCTNLIEGYRWQRERKEVEIARLRAEQEITKQLASIEAAVDGIAILQDNCYQYLNSSHIKMFGYEQSQELLGKNWRLFYSPQEIERFEQEVFPVLAADHHWKGEAIAMRKDGTTFVEELSLTLTEDQLLICVCRDITDRKQIESQLAESEAKYRRLVEDVNDLIWSTDVQGRFTYLSPQFKTLLGWDENQWLGKPLLRLTHPQDRPLLRAEYQAIIAGEKTLSHLECRYRHQQGRYLWVRVSATAIKNAEGAVVQFQGILSDISNLKEAEIALQASENRFRKVFDSNVVGMMFTDLSGKVIDANDRFLEMIGYKRSDLINDQKICRNYGQMNDGSGRC